MSSYGEFPAVVIDIGGVQIRLVTPRQLSNAVTRKRVEPSTLIIYEKSASQSEEIFAGECELLIPIFEKEGISQPAPAPKPPAPIDNNQYQSDGSQTPPPDDGQDREQTPGESETDEDASSPKKPWGEPDEGGTADPIVNGGEDKTEKGHGTTPTPGDDGEDKKDGDDDEPSKFSGTLIAGIVGFVGLAGILVFALQSESEPEIVEPPSETYFSMSGLSVRKIPTTESGEKVEDFLERNEEIEGYRLPGNRDWVKITSGPYTGKHVSYKYLDTEKRVFVDKSTGRQEPYPVVKDTKAYASPDNKNDLVASIDFPASVEVIGSISSQTAEVFNANWPTPIAYVPWDAFGGEGGVGAAREIRVVNNCLGTQNFTLSYFENGQNRRVNSFWEYTRNMQAFARYDFKRIKATSAEIYYYDLGPGFHLLNRRNVLWTSKDRLRVNGVAKKASTATPRATGPGTYEITFCPIK
ncbi:MAG: hypothetical protein AAGH57_02570 [Pseudomonadota bacterium]